MLLTHLHHSQRHGGHKRQATHQLPLCGGWPGHLACHGDYFAEYLGLYYGSGDDGDRKVAGDEELQAFWKDVTVSQLSYDSGFVVVVRGLLCTAVPAGQCVRVLMRTAGWG